MSILACSSRPFPGSNWMLPVNPAEHNLHLIQIKTNNKSITEGISQYEDGYIFNNYDDALDWADSDYQYQDRVGHYNLESVYLYSKEDIDPKYKISIDSSTYNL